MVQVMDLFKVLIKETVMSLIAGYGPLQSSHQGDHHEIAGYGAGYGPLQHSH